MSSEQDLLYWLVYLLFILFWMFSHVRRLKLCAIIMNTTKQILLLNLVKVNYDRN